MDLFLILLTLILVASRVPPFLVVNIAQQSRTAKFAQRVTTKMDRVAACHVPRDALTALPMFFVLLVYLLTYFRIPSVHRVKH